MNDPVPWGTILFTAWCGIGLIVAAQSGVICDIIHDYYSIKLKRAVVIILLCGPIVWAIMTVIGIVMFFVHLIKQINRWMKGGDFLTTTQLIMWLNFRELIGYPYKNPEDEDE